MTYSKFETKVFTAVLLLALVVVVMDLFFFVYT